MRRWILLGLGLTVAVVVGVALIAVSRLDAYLNENRTWLEEQAEAALGRPVRFAEIGVSLWPALGVRVDALRIAEDPGYGSGDFLSVQDAEVRVRLLPALVGRFEISRVVLEKPSITVVRGPEGLNIESLGSSSDAEVAPDGEVEPDTSGAAFAIGLLDIDRGSLRFLDRSVDPPVELVVEQLDFEVSDLSPTEPIRLDLSAAILGASAPNLEASGSVGPLDGNAPDAVPLALQIRLEPLAIDDLMRLPEIAALMSEGTSAAGVLRARAELSGTLSALQVESTLDGREASLRAGDGFVKPEGVPLHLDVSVKREGEALRIDSARLTLADAQLDASGTATLGSPLRYALQLRSERLPLGDLAGLLPALAETSLSGSGALDLRVESPGAASELPLLAGTLSLADVAAKSKGGPALQGLSTTFFFEEGGLRLPETGFDLSGSPVELSARVADLSRPVLDFDLGSPRLRTASLGVSGEEGAAEDVLEAFTAKGALSFPESGPDLRAKLASGRGTLRGIEYRDLSGQLRYEKGVATLEKLDLHAYGGELVASGSFDGADSENPAFDLSTRLSGVEIQPLLRSQLPLAAPFVTGRIATNLDLKGRGGAWETLRRNLTGAGNFALADGTLNDLNIADEALRSMTGVPGLTNMLSPGLKQKYPGLFEAGKTTFEDLDAKVQIEDGWANVRDLKLVAESFSLAGDGRVSLAGEVDMTTTFTASEGLTRDLVAEVKPLAYLRDRDGRMRVPLRWSGSYPGLTPQPDQAVIARALQRALVGGLLGGGRGDEPTGAEGGEPGDEPPPAGKSLRDLLRGLPSQ